MIEGDKKIVKIDDLMTDPDEYYKERAALIGKGDLHAGQVVQGGELGPNGTPLVYRSNSIPLRSEDDSGALPDFKEPSES